MTSYVVLDLETANADRASICQLGLVVVEDGTIVERVDQLVNPDDYFDPFNVATHGIDAERVKGSPTFSEIFDRLASLLSGRIVVTHGAFDRGAIGRASARYNLTVPPITWFDNQRVVRRTWPEFAQTGYALGKLVEHFGIPLRHHDALEDATATADIFQRALTISNRSIEDWLVAVEQALNPPRSVERAGVASGLFAGETIVFTGTLIVLRQEAADAASACGFDVAQSVTKKTTTLCVGIQDRDRLAGYEKSSNHRKAEELIRQAFDISIIAEEDFWQLVKVGTAASAAA